MRIFRHNRKKILIISLITAFIVVLFLLYRTKDTVIGEVVLDSEQPSSSNEAVVEQLPLDKRLELTSDNIIWFTNKYRAQYGLRPLELNTQLRNAAYYKSQDMFHHNYFAHERPANNMGFDNFIDNQNYEFIKVAENLARGNFTTSRAIVDAWMESPNHRSNILDPVFTEIGVSVDRGIMNGEPITLITQYFGKPKISCPKVDTDLSQQIKLFNQKLTRLKKSIDIDEGDAAELIAEYNSIIRKRAPIVTLYNSQVEAYDRCVAQYIF